MSEGFGAVHQLIFPSGELIYKKSGFPWWFSCILLQLFKRRYAGDNYLILKIKLW